MDISSHFRRHCYPDLLAAGLSESQFMSFGLPGDFIDRLGDAATAFEATFTAPVTAVDNRVAATAEIGESIRRGMIASETPLLPEEGWPRFADGVVGGDAVMKNHYAANIGKLAAWLSASHVKRDPKKPTPPTP